MVSRTIGYTISISTVLTIRRVMEVMMSAAVRNGLIDKNPVKLSRPLVIQKTIKVMSITDMGRILSAAWENIDDNASDYRVGITRIEIMFLFILLQ